MFAVVLFVLIPFTIYSFRGSKEAEAPVVPTATPIVSRVIPTTAPTATPSPVITQTEQPLTAGSVKRYTSKRFSFSYPQRWSLQMLNDTQDKISVFVGQNLETQTGLPGIVVDASKGSASGLASFEQNLTGTLGYVPNTDLSSKPFAHIYTGTVPFSIVDGQNVSVAHQEIVATTYLNGWEYHVTFGYVGNTRNPDNETFFSKLLRTFSFIASR